jgi:hypothetical protein
MKQQEEVAEDKPHNSSSILLGLTNEENEKWDKESAWK